jgi:hypothetical protein
VKSEDYRVISGSQKAAILMLALSEEQCTRLFSMMHEDEIKDISSAMSQLGAVRAEVVERLCVDFVDHMGASGNLVGSYESTERLLQKTLPTILRDSLSYISNILDFARSLPIPPPIRTYPPASGSPRWSAWAERVAQQRSREADSHRSEAKSFVADLRKLPAGQAHAAQ